MSAILVYQEFADFKFQNMNQYIPVAHVNPSYISITRDLAFKDNKSYFFREDNRADRIKNSKRMAQGFLSVNAKRKMQKAIEYLLYLSAEKRIYNRSSKKFLKFKVAFVTLTLSSEQKHSDNVIRKKLLHQLLIELKQNYNVENYVWKAEKQVNGNIHFHIVLDRFIPHQQLRSRWNRIQNKLGYINAYQSKHGGKSNPNSVDIHSLYNIKNIGSYLSKYMSKNVEYQDNMNPAELQKLIVKGKLWGSNHELSNIKGASIPVDSFVEKELQMLTASEKVKTYVTDYFTVIYINVNQLFKLGSSLLYSTFLDYINDNFTQQTATYQLII